MTSCMFRKQLTNNEISRDEREKLLPPVQRKKISRTLGMTVLPASHLKQITTRTLKILKMIAPGLLKGRRGNACCERPSIR